MNPEKDLPESKEKCKICGDTGYYTIKRTDKAEFVTQCICLFKGVKTRLFGEYFTDKTLDNYEERNESMKIAKETILSDLDKSYYIYGAVGLGKTHILAGIYEKLYGTGEWLYTKVFTETQIIDNIKKDGSEFLKDTYTRIVIVDDIGKIKIADWQAENMYNFFNHIYRTNTQLLISSNYSIAEINNIYGGAITRRIDEMCHLIEIRR